MDLNHQLESIQRTITLPKAMPGDQQTYNTAIQLRH